MDIGALAGLYGGVPARVISRAREYMRLTAARKSSAIDLTTPVACLLVAGKSLDETLDARRLSSLAGVNHRLVEQSVRKILGAVDVKSVVQTTPAALCIRFGCEAITELVNRVYAEYQVIAERMSRGKGKGRVFDFREPVFAAACLFASSKHAHLRVDKVKLLNAVCGNPKSFEAIVSSIETHCKASLSAAILSRRKRAGTPSKAAKSGSAAEIADAADDAERERARGQDQNGSGGTPLKTPNKAFRRLYERSQGSSQDDTIVATPTKPKPATPRAGVTDLEYTAWREQALAHMQQKMTAQASS